MSAFNELEQSYLTPSETDSKAEENAEQYSLLVDKKYTIENLLDELYEDGCIENVEELENQLMDIEEDLLFLAMAH